MSVKSKIGGVAVLFNFSVSINTVTSEQPTDFTKNYLETLANMATIHLSEQLGEAMLDRVRIDFKEFPKDKLWEIKKEAGGD